MSRCVLSLPLVSLLLIATLSSTGCATLQAGTKQNVPFSSSPDGATVEVDGRCYTTPVVVALARSRDHVAKISMPGYSTKVVNIARKPTGRTGGNVAVGGLIGFLVDLLTGANNDLIPESIDVVLAPEPRERPDFARAPEDDASAMASVTVTASAQ